MKTSSDYLREYNEAQNEVKRLENEISERLLKLSVMRPNVVILKLNGVDIYAKGLTRYYIDNLPVETRIQYIRIIEEAVASEATFIQGKLFN
jgi:hypothetical protein